VSENIRDVTGGLHISVSALRQIQECPREFLFARIRGEKPEHVSSRMVLGSACHRALARFYEALRDGEPEPALDELVGIAQAAIEEAGAGPVPILFDDEGDIGALKAESARLLEAFMASAYRPDRVLAVEEPFAIPLVDLETGEVPYPELLAGVFDLVVEEEGGDVLVLDHKFGKRRPQQVEEGDLQLGLYSLAAREVFHLEKAPRVGHQIVLRTKIAKVEIALRNVEEAELRESGEAAMSALELIRVAVDHPAPERLLGRRRSWRCSGCAYRTRCSAR
jgi:CRISPR/Cas system-associated exonuclease Cas4 (RecB family)